jgi:predicted component of type VI protein secretion system
VRVLRHGDELRLGRMVLRVFFEHSSDRNRA